MSIVNKTFIAFDTAGLEMAVQDAVAIPAGTRAFLMSGRDGTTARVPILDSSARFIVVGAGTAGANAGGVFSIQGIAGGVATPVSVASLPLPSGAAQEHVTAPSPHSVRLSDGGAFYDAAKTGQLPTSLVAGRLDVIVGSWLGSTTPTVGQKAMAASLPVVIASDQGAIPISAASLPLPSGAAQEHATAASPHAVRLSDGAAFYTAPAAAQLPGSLVGGRLDINTGAWLGSTAPTVGQKASAASLPVVIASDQSTLPISAASLPLPSGAAQEHVISSSPNATRLSDGTSFYDATKTGQLPTALVGGRLDQNLGAWLGATTPTVGQKLMAASIPVVLSSDHSAITVTGSITATDASVGVIGAAAPASATQIGASDGTNLQSLRAFDADTGAGSEFIFGVSLRKSGSGGSVEAATTTNPLRIDPTGTTAQPVTDNGGSLTVDSTQLPASLVSGRFDVNVGAWLTSTAPTVGQKAMAASLPVVIASDQPALAISAASLPLPSGAAQEHTTAGSPHSTRLSDGSAFYDATKTGQLPTALVSGRLDINLGAWLGATTPTVGQKTMVNSLPVVLSSDHSTIAISAASLPLPTGAAQEHATAGSPSSVRLSDGSAFYDGAKTGQLPAALVGARLDVNTGAWLGSTAPTVGQKTSANSLPFVIASDQSTLPVKTEVQIDYDTSAGTQSLSVIGLALPSATGAVAGGTATNPIRVDPTGTTAQPITDNGGSLTIDSTQLPAALVGARFDVNNGAWLGSTAPTVGQKTMANSVPVVFASDQSALTITGSITATNPSVGTTGAAIPASATLVGGSDGTNLQASRVYDGDTGAGTEYVLGAVLRKRASGGTVEAGTSADPLRTDPTGTTAQPVTDNGGSLTVDSTQLPAALVGGRLDIILSSWLGSTAPTVGQKTMANSLPVVLASDQSTLTVSNPAVGTNNVAIPTSSQQIGGSDGTNLQAARIFDADSGAGTQYVLGTVLRKIASGGSVEAGTAADPLRVDPTGTTIQPVSSTQLPAALVGARLDTNNGAWLGSTAPTVGQKTGANSLPVVIASDQTAFTVNIGTSGSLALDATLTGGTQKAIVRGGAKGATTAADITSTAEGADHQAIDAQIYHSGVAVNPTVIRALTSTDVVTSVQGTAAAVAGAWPVKVTDGTNTQPTGDTVGRSIFHKITDGTNTAAVKAASTAPVAGDTALVVAISPNSSISTAARVVTTSTPTNVAASITSVTVLAANANRINGYIFNDSTATLTLKYGATASATSMIVKLFTNDVWNIDDGYKGIIDGIWSAATGSARVTENV